jgi:AcrR family transcriptional regulator
MSEPPRRPRSDQLRNRDALLAAARELMAEHGIDVPLDLVAKRAGLANATLYRHFPARRDLISAVLLGNLRRSDGVLAQASAGVSGWAGLTEYVTWLFAEQMDNPAYMSALRAVPSGGNEEVDRLRNQTLRALEVLISRAKDEGNMRADRWIEDVFLFLALNEHLAQAGHRDPRAASQRLLELALDTLAAPHQAEPGVTQEPDTVLALRHSLGQELAGLPAADG